MEPKSAGGGEGRIRTSVERSLKPLTVPNFITFIRMAIIPFFVLAVLEHDFLLAVWTFVVAGLTDSLDGYLARRLHARSLIGAYLDPIADKLLITAAYVVLTIPHGQQVAIPLWLAILALFRDFLILVVALLLYAVEGISRFPPSLLGKATTFMHVATVTVVLFANLIPIPRWVPGLCFYVSFGLVIVSGFNYIYRASRLIESVRVKGDDQAGLSGDGPPPRD